MRFLIEELLLEDIWDLKKYFPNIPDEKYVDLLKLDPTYKGGDIAGTYAKWILGLANKNKLDNIGHITDILKRFDSEKKNLINKDIMRYKSLEDLDSMLNDPDSYKNKSHRQEVRQRQKDRKAVDLSSEAKKVYEDSEWEVWVPETYAASCKLGQGTRWCTASTEDSYYYNMYKNTYGGDYYIIINKHNPEEKYQFHFESGQYMDSDDSSIDLGDFMLENKGLSDFFKNKIKLPDKIDIEELSEFIGNKYDIKKGWISYILDGDTEELFDFYYISEVSDVIEYIDEIDSKSWEMLSKLGVTEDTLEDELYENDDLLDAFVVATRDGLSYGCANDLYNTVYNNLRNIIGDFTIDTEYDETAKRDYSYIIPQNKGKSVLDIDWRDVDGSEGNLIYSVLSGIYSESDADNAYGFDKSIYNEVLQDRLYDIE